MAVNISGLRRNIKNVAHNYTDAQVKVREATSNDPWGPSSTMMSEIADLTYNVVAYSEIMQMIWKRLNDNGKNWRHVYKALVLLEYLIKTGSEKVAQQCKENIFAIQALKDFQYLDDNKDQGINVREKAKSLVALLKDDERLRNERVRALKAKERFAQSTAGIGSDTVYNHSRSRYDHQRSRHSPSDYGLSGGSSDPNLNPDLEAARPQTAGEEELQLQLALAMSREEAEQEESKSKSDDMRLQLALKKSQEEDEQKKTQEKPSNDLLDLDFGNPVVSSPTPAVPVRTEASLDPWGMPASPPKNDPWNMSTSANSQSQQQPHPWDAPPKKNDPWSSNSAPQDQAFQPGMQTSPQPASKDSAFVANDPWNPIPQSNGRGDGRSVQNPTSLPLSGNFGDDDLFSPQAQHDLAEFDIVRSEIEKDGYAGNHSNNGNTTSPNPFDMSGLQSGLTNSDRSNSSGSVGGAKPKKSVQALLGEHSNLVNLDNLVSGPANARNPFEQQQQNPFQVKAQKPPMKELMNKNLNENWSKPQARENNTELNPFF